MALCKPVQNSDSELSDRRLTLRVSWLGFPRTELENRTEQPGGVGRRELESNRSNSSTTTTNNNNNSNNNNSSSSSSSNDGSSTNNMQRRTS